MKKPLSILPKISGLMICPSEVWREYETSVGPSGGHGAPPRELSMLDMGLVKPLVEDGDNGTPLTLCGRDGDLRISDGRRRWGVDPAYSSRGVKLWGFGNAGERDSGASPDGVLCEYDIIL